MPNELPMKKYLTYLLCIVSTIGWAENSFDAFCSKFPLMELPIVSDSRIYGDNLYYFQLDKESSITEEEFEKFVKTSRWGQYQQPGDSLLHIYHYIPAGRAYFKSFILLFVRFKDLFEKDWETKVKREKKDYSITLSGEIDLQNE